MNLSCSLLFSPIKGKWNIDTTHTHLQEVLCALSQVLGQHRCVEGLGVVVEEPALVAHNVVVHLFEVGLAVGLWDLKKHTIDRQ